MPVLPLYFECGENIICLYSFMSMDQEEWTQGALSTLTPDLLLFFSCSVMSDTLQPHGLLHTRLPCTLPSLGACSNSCILSQWCHSTILLSVIPFFYLQPFPASGSFLMSELFPSGGQSIGASASASVLPINIQNWFPFRWTFIKRLFSSSLFSSIRVVSSAYLRLLNFALAILIPDCS